MCKFVHVYICICVHVYMFICVYVHIFTCVHCISLKQCTVQTCFSTKTANHIVCLKTQNPKSHFEWYLKATLYVKYCQRVHMYSIVHVYRIIRNDTCTPIHLYISQIMIFNNFVYVFVILHLKFIFTYCRDLIEQLKVFRQLKGMYLKIW